MSVPLAVGVDVGGTKILYALVDAQGHVVESLRRDSSYGMEPLGWVARAVQDIQALCGSQSHGHLVGVGVGFAGQVDRDNGLVQGSPNLGWKEVPLRALFQKELSLPVTVLNDVQAATWGEWRLGGGEGFSDLVCLFVGTGIG
ncbi:MAG: ROK family protein, partial [Chloroflexi bacterium]|nr:ROK family protein [Chloroflexota bacterium]